MGTTGRAEPGWDMLGYCRPSGAAVANPLPSTVAMNASRWARATSAPLGALFLIAEGLPAAVSHLWGAARDVPGHATTGNLVQRRGLFGEVERVFIAHVDDTGAHLDVFGGGRDSTEQRHRGGGLRHEVVDTEGRVVHADFVRSRGDLQMSLGDPLRRWPARPPKA